MRREARTNDDLQLGNEVEYAREQVLEVGEDRVERGVEAGEQAADDAVRLRAAEERGRGRDLGHDARHLVGNVGVRLALAGAGGLDRVKLAARGGEVDDNLANEGRGRRGRRVRRVRDLLCGRPSAPHLTRTHEEERTDRRDRALDVLLQRCEGRSDLRVRGLGALDRVGRDEAEEGDEEDDREGRELGELHRGGDGGEGGGGVRRGGRWRRWVQDWEPAPAVFYTPSTREGMMSRGAL
jgi:hypothetical protein